MIDAFKLAFSKPTNLFGKILLSISFCSFFLTCVFLMLFSASKWHILYYFSFSLFALSVAFDFLFFHRDLRVYPFECVALVFLLITVISQQINPLSSFVSTPFSVVLLFLFTFRFCRERTVASVIPYLVFLSFVVFLVAFYVVYARQLISLDFSTRLGDAFDNQNSVGYYFVYGFASTLWVLFHKKWNWLWSLLLPFIVLGAFSTGSRSSLIIIAILAFAFAYFWFGKKHKFVFIGFIIFFLCLTGILLSLPQFADLLERILASVFGQDTSTIERTQVLREGIIAFLESPLFGWGYNGMRLYSTNHVFSHNNLVGLLSDFGIFGFLSFETMIIIPAIYAVRNKENKDMFIYVWLILLAVFSIQFFYCNYQRKLEYIFLAFACSRTPVSWAGLKDGLLFDLEGSHTFRLKI